MAGEMICPRRFELGGMGVGGPFNYPDHDQWRDDQTCSYCGSMSPETFMQAARDGKSIGPTDKNYKAYVTEPLTDDEKAIARQQQIGRYVGMGISEEQATSEADADPVLGEGKHLGKFYYVHLSEEQQNDFIAMLNAKSVHVGYPGRFYRLPFFITRKAAE